MFDKYSKIKLNITSNLTKLEQIATNEHVKVTTELLQEKLRNDIFSIVVVGQFKRGKTTFINTLLGKDFLPTAIIPLTSIITILNYGEKLHIIIFFENKKQQEIESDDLPLYITEKHNPKNNKGVNKVEINYPSEYLKNGVQIIDTPGIASVYEHNTVTTYEYLPHADVAIFLLSVDPPITKAELLFLHDLKNLVGKIFFIQNKIDTVAEADAKESLAFNKKIIEKEIGFKEVEIYPISAKNALEGKKENNTQKIEKSGLIDFEQLLEKFLINQKGEFLLKSITQKMSNLIKEETFLLEITKKSLDFSLKDLESKIEKFKIFIKDINQEKIDSTRLLKEEIKILKKETLEKDLEKLKQEKTVWLIKEVKKFAAEHKTDSNKKFVEAMDEFVDTQIKDIFNIWRTIEEKSLEVQIEKILQRFTKHMDNILEQIIRSSSEIINISYQKFQIEKKLPTKIEFRFKIIDQSDIIGLTMDLVRKALPKTFAQKLFLKEIKERITMLIDRHCGKTRYDFSQRMEKLVQNYSLSVTEIVASTQKDILNALETGITLKKTTSAEVNTQEANLLKKTNILEEIKNSLQENTYN